MKRRIFVGLLLALSALAQAKTQTFVTDIVIQGIDAGKNTFVLDDDGTCVSTSVVKIATLDFTQEIKSKFTKGKFGAIEFKHIQNGKTNEAKLNGKVLSSRTGTGEWTTQTLDRAPTCYFSNFHPQFARSIFDLQKSEVELLVIDSATFVKAKVTTGSTRIVKLDGGALSAQMFQLSLGGIQIETGIDSRDGWVLGFNVPTQKASWVRHGITDLFVDPLSKYPELSQPTFETVSIPVSIAKMRDQVELHSSIVKPKGEGKFPTILMRTPYGRQAQLDAYSSFYAQRGYVVMSQDVRGMGDSQGAWDPFMYERKDGYDTINWIARQPWSNGKVGMIGGSYSGLVQWQAAVERPAALKCIIPQVSPPDPFYNIPFDHGAFFLMPNIWWSKIVAVKKPDLGAITTATPDLKPFNLLPLSKIDDAAIGKDVPFWQNWLARDTATKWSGANYQAELKNVTIPSLMVSGWWDGDMAGTTMNWAALRQAGRTNHWLIMGPWSHAFNTASSIADEDYGSDALLELDSVFLRFFDTYLKGKDVQFANRPRAQVFLTGANEWRGMPNYPHPLSRPVTWVLSSAKNAKNATSDGTLTDKFPTGKLAASSKIFYDPAKVAPDPKSMKQPEASFKFDFASIIGDELFFRSAPMTQPLDLSGPITLDLYFSSTAKDCDFFAYLLDIDPTGQPRMIHQGGKIRASYHGGMDKRVPLTPGKIYKTTVKLWDIAHEFKVGHRVGVFIGCNLFPQFDRNLGLAEPPLTATKMVSSTQTIYHDAKHPSALHFMVMPPLE